MNIKKAIVFAYFVLGLRFLCYSQEVDPCGDMPGEMIITPENVSEPQYYTNLIKKYSCDKALQARLFYFRAFVKYSQNDKMGAMEDLTSSIEINPNHVAYFYRGSLKAEYKDFNGAVKDYTESLSRCKIKKLYFKSGADNVTQADILLRRGKSNMNLKKYALALQDFKQLTDIDAKSKDGYLFLAMCEHELGDKENACANWSRASELGNNSAFQFLQKNCQ